MIRVIALLLQKKKKVVGDCGNERTEESRLRTLFHLPYVLSISNKPFCLYMYCIHWIFS